MVKVPQARRQWGYGELTVEDVVDAATNLIERDGVEKLSMRRLAKELGVSSMAVYYYIKDKDELLDRVIDRVLASVPTPTDSVDWQERLKGFYRASRTTMSRYPGLHLSAQSRRLTPAGRLMIRQVHATLVEAGLGDEEADTAALTITHFLYGSLNWEAAVKRHQPRRAKRVDFDLEFEKGLDLLFRGIKALRS